MGIFNGLLAQPGTSYMPRRSTSGRRSTPPPDGNLVPVELFVPSRLRGSIDPPTVFVRAEDRERYEEYREAVRSHIMASSASAQMTGNILRRRAAPFHRVPTQETMEYGAEIARLKDDENKTWPEVIHLLIRDHSGWARIKQYRRELKTRGRMGAFSSLLSWARSKYRSRSSKR
jgi:hypothetical protein